MDVYLYISEIKIIQVNSIQFKNTHGRPCIVTLDANNGILIGLPENQLRKLQLVQNYAAKVVCQKLSLTVQQNV